MLAFFFLKKNRCLCWLPCWDVSQKWETHDCKLEERPYHKVTENLVTLCSRLHGLQEGRICKRRSWLRKSQGKGWMSGLVCGFVCFCYCFLSICSKIPEERNGFSQNGSSKKKPTESLEKWEGLGQGESTRCVYDQGARKHVSQPPHVVQGPPKDNLEFITVAPPIRLLKDRGQGFKGSSVSWGTQTVAQTSFLHSVDLFFSCQNEALWVPE